MKFRFRRPVGRSMRRPTLLPGSLSPIMLRKPMLERYRDYSERLEGDYSVDFWSDVQIDQAIGVLRTFLEDDWASLSKSWRTQSKCWKMRCAQTLDDGLTDEGFAILLAMARDPDEELVMTALEALGSFPMSPEVAAIRRQWKPGAGGEA